MQILHGFADIKKVGDEPDERDVRSVGIALQSVKVRGRHVGLREERYAALRYAVVVDRNEVDVTKRRAQPNHRQKRIMSLWQVWMVDHDFTFEMSIEGP